MNDNTNTRVKIGEVRLSYCHLFQPEAVADGGEKKYSVSILIPKSNTKLVEEVKAAIKAAFMAGVASRFGGKQPAPGTWKNPLRDGDAERPDDDTYAGCFFINATSRTKPGIVKIVKMNGEKKLVEVTDEDEVYSGCYGAADINFFPYNNNGAIGISCGLNNVLKLEDGEKLSGTGLSADAAFGDLA